MSLRSDAEKIYSRAIEESLPDSAVKAALEKLEASGKLYLVAVGKAAWQMGKTASDILGGHIADGIVVTKHGYSKGEITGLRIFEAGHPVPDSDSYKATEAVLELVRPLGENDTVVFLLSGGGSALFEKPLIPESDMEKLTKELLSSGADIVEMNTLRKRFSAVKGGRFGQLCAPAKVFSVVLSDVIGNRLDMIASGPAYPDSSTCADARAIVKRYGISLTEQMEKLIDLETPKALSNVETHITGSVSRLAASAEKTCRELGYEAEILTDCLCCEARHAGVFLSCIGKTYANSDKKLAFIVGGETVVRLTGTGLGGRNQELALAAADGIAGFDNVCIFSVGSDGTDGPTDAAGGYVDGKTKSALKAAGYDIAGVLKNNDSYHALDAVGGLIKTGATGTNVNDLSVLLIG